MKIALLFVSALMFSPGAGFTDVVFDFDGYPEEIKGPAGAIREFTAYATLTCGAGEAQTGWGLSMTADGGTIVDVSVEGLTVMTDKGEIPVDGPAFFSVHGPTRDGVDDDRDHIVHANDRNRVGAISTISILNYPGDPCEFLPDTVHRLARITVEVVMPPRGETRVVTLRYEDGFCPVSTPCLDGRGQQNIYSDQGNYPSADVTVSRTITRVEGKSDFRRGDANEDGAWDMSDAIFTFNYLFTGGAAPNCLSSIDANDDGATDISDPIYLLYYLFYGGDRPRDPFAECGADSTVDYISCESFAPCL